jgi:hypothetical protein
MTETPDSQFIGKWRLSERGMFEGIEIEILKDKKGKFTGAVTKLNDNKYVQMFMQEGDILLSEIKRNSNFSFVISEKKIAAPLFSAYGQSTTTEFEAAFDGKEKILLGKNGTSGSYIKLK